MSEQIYTKALKEFTPLSVTEKKQSLLDVIASFGNVHPIF
jgi:hypothetical protein